MINPQFPRSPRDYSFESMTRWAAMIAEHTRTWIDGYDDIFIHFALHCAAIRAHPHIELGMKWDPWGVRYGYLCSYQGAVCELIGKILIILWYMDNGECVAIESAEDRPNQSTKNTDFFVVSKTQRYPVQVKSFKAALSARRVIISTPEERCKLTGVVLKEARIRDWFTEHQPVDLWHLLIDTSTGQAYFNFSAHLVELRNGGGDAAADPVLTHMLMMDLREHTPKGFGDGHTQR